MRRSVWSINGTVRDNRARSKLRVRVHNRIAANDDIIKTEVTLSLHAKAADQRLVDMTAIVNRDQVIFTQPRLLVDLDVLANVSPEHTIVQNLERRVHGENTPSRTDYRLVHNPPPQMVRGPPVNETTVSDERSKL